MHLEDTYMHTYAREYIHMYIYIGMYTVQAVYIRTHFNNILVYNCRYSVWQVQYT